MYIAIIIYKLKRLFSSVLYSSFIYWWKIIRTLSGLYIHLMCFFSRKLFSSSLCTSNIWLNQFRMSIAHVQTKKATLYYISLCICCNQSLVITRLKAESHLQYLRLYVKYIHFLYNTSEASTFSPEQIHVTCIILFFFFLLLFMCLCNIYEKVQVDVVYSQVDISKIYIHFWWCMLFNNLYRLDRPNKFIEP